MIFGLTHKIDVGGDQQEHRTALCPCGVGSLVHAGHEVLVEARIGEGNGFPDDDFRREGAKVIHSFDEVVRRCQVIVRVAPPGPRLGQLMKPEQVICSLLQYGVDEAQVAAEFAKTGATAVALEHLRDRNGGQPVFTQMSEITGAMLPHIAAWLQMSPQGGRGLLLAGITGQPAAQVVIIGAGALGLRAAHEFLGAGAQVDLIDTDIEKLRLAEKELHYQGNTRINNPQGLQRVVRYADVLICAVNLDRCTKNTIVSKDLVSLMKPGSVIIDASIDQGGGVETSRLTTAKEPIFKVYGITHYCVPNISALVPRTASRALDSVVSPFLLELGKTPDMSTLDENPNFMPAVYVRNGKIISALLSPSKGKL